MIDCLNERKAWADLHNMQMADEKKQILDLGMKPNPFYMFYVKREYPEEIKIVERERRKDFWFPILVPLGCLAVAILIIW